MPIPAALRPEEDFRVWIDGSYKDGVIGYGIVILPGRVRLYGGKKGENAAEAEALAAAKALEALPEHCSCVIYCDFLPVVMGLNVHPETARQGQRIRAQYMNDTDPRHREAHELANQGRCEAE